MSNSQVLKNQLKNRHMKIIKYLVLILMYICAFDCSSQSNDKWRAGSAYSLNGKVYILTVFISESEWIYDEKLELYNKIYEAENWLVKQAQNYSKTLQFEGGNFGLNKTVIIDNIQAGTGSGNESVDLTTKVLRKVG
jgi:hypothetical protein